MFVVVHCGWVGGLPGSSHILLPMTDQETINELRAALRVALSLLESVDADANNVRLDIQRFQRAHHRAIDDAVRGTNKARGQ